MHFKVVECQPDDHKLNAFCKFVCGFTFAFHYVCIQRGATMSFSQARPKSYESLQSIGYSWICNFEYLLHDIDIYIYFFFTFYRERKFHFVIRDHPFKTSACLRGGEGCPHGPMVERSQYIRIKNPLHKHFVVMPMVGS